MIKSLKQKINKKYLTIILTALLACVLVIFFVYVTSASKFSMENVVVCRNLDKNDVPIDIIQGETTPSDRIILCFDYSEANIGMTLRVVWYYNDRQVTDDVLKLPKVEGKRSMALLSNDGSVLPKGAYCVKIFLGSKVLKQVSLVIS